MRDCHRLGLPSRNTIMPPPSRLSGARFPYGKATGARKAIGSRANIIGAKGGGRSHVHAEGGRGKRGRVNFLRGREDFRISTPKV